MQKSLQQTRKKKSQDTAASTPTVKRRKHSAKIFTRSTRKAGRDSARTNKTDVAASAAVTPAVIDQSTHTVAVGRPNSGSSGERLTFQLPASTVPSQPPPTYKQVMHRPHRKPIKNFPEWHEIVKVLTHQKRRNRMFYKVLWQETVPLGFPRET